MLQDSRFWIGVAIGAGGLMLWQRKTAMMPKRSA